MKLKPTIPIPLPPHHLSLKALSDQSQRARAVLAQFDKVISSVKHPLSVFSLLTYQEALSSVDPHKRPISMKKLLSTPTAERTLQSLHYQKALLHFAKIISRTPLSSPLLCTIHKTLKKRSKGKHAEIGKFRTRQNWIGPEGCGIDKAYFLPPDPKIVFACMKDLQKYLHRKEKDPLVQLALYFAGLLIIHPFMDGNGRVARITIPLILYKKKVLSAPLFFLGDYLKKHRLEYLKRLFAITEEGDWDSWISFFLKGIITEGKKCTKHAQSLLILYNALLQTVPRRNEIDPLFKHLLFDSKKLSEETLKKLKAKKLIIPFKKGSSLYIVKGIF